MACPPPVNPRGARAAERLSGGLRAPRALTPLFRLRRSPRPRSGAALLRHFRGSLRAAPTRRARPLHGASWRASAPPDSLTAIGRLGNSPAAGVRWVPWLRPVPALVCAPSARLRNGRSARAPSGCPHARWVLRSASLPRSPRFALRPLRPPLRSVRPRSLDIYTYNGGSPRVRVRPPSGGACAPFGRCLPETRPPSPALRPACAPLRGALSAKSLWLAHGLSGGLCRAGVSNGAPRLTDTPALLARECDFTLTLP